MEADPRGFSRSIHSNTSPSDLTRSSRFSVASTSSAGIGGTSSCSFRRCWQMGSGTKSGLAPMNCPACSHLLVRTLRRCCNGQIEVTLLQRPNQSIVCKQMTVNVCCVEHWAGYWHCYHMWVAMLHSQAMPQQYTTCAGRQPDDDMLDVSQLQRSRNGAALCGSAPQVAHIDH